MLFMMVVSLYTSRVILNAMGVAVFGINVVGGVVDRGSVKTGFIMFSPMVCCCFMA